MKLSESIAPSCEVLLPAECQIFLPAERKIGAHRADADVVAICCTGVVAKALEAVVLAFSLQGCHGPKWDASSPSK